MTKPTQITSLSPLFDRVFLSAMSFGCVVAFLFAVASLLRLSETALNTKILSPVEFARHFEATDNACVFDKARRAVYESSALDASLVAAIRKECGQAGPASEARQSPSAQDRTPAHAELTQADTGSAEVARQEIRFEHFKR